MRNGAVDPEMLKVSRAGADARAVQLERLVIDAGGRTMATDFHPRLTVVGGLEPAVREAMVGEIIGAMAGARPGVHLEIRALGRSLTVFRPASGRHRVVDTDAPADITTECTGPGGQIDLFAAAGIDRAEARAAIRLDRDHLVLADESDAWTAQLAGVDQDQLWTAAMQASAAEALLARVSAAAGTSTDDAAIVTQVEEVHHQLVEASETYERIRLISLTLGTAGTLGAAAAAATARGLFVIPLLVAAVVGAVLGVVFRRRVERAEAAERSVLADAGADDYSAFHFNRVSALLDNDNERRRFMLAVSDHGRAMGRWEQVAGEVPLSFALAHEHAIRATAELHAEMEPTLAVHGPGGRDIGDQLALAVRRHIDALRALSPQDPLPLVVDDPFAGLDHAHKPLLLELLQAQADGVQVIVVTADAEVTEWARVEAMTGDIAVVEPALGRVVSA